MRCNISIFSDSSSASSGTPLTQSLCSGMYFNSLNYNLPLNADFTESVTLVGNDKSWIYSNFYFNGQFSATDDSPASGIQRRQNVIMGSGVSGCIFPTELPGVTVVNGSGYNMDTGSG